MKKVLVVAFLPMVLLGLETVNLIKDAGFEKDSEVWLKRFLQDGEYDTTLIDHHNLDSACVGSYCASIDTRPFTAPPPALRGELYQVLRYSKKLEDLDSLAFFHMAVFRDEGSKISTWGYGLRMLFSNPFNGDVIEVYYFWLAPDLDPMDDEATIKVFPDTVYEEGIWKALHRNVNEDLIGIKGLSGEIELDTFVLYGTGLDYGTWRGQKAFFDGIRLTGYADYDVGVKEILSGDSLEIGTPYQPVARIKNFGRENADTFLVMAEIWDGSSLIYVDTLPWSLESDTEDTVEFAEFFPSSTGPYTLTVRTFMEPDESDADDELSKTIGHAAIKEPVTHHDGLSLEVRSLASPLRVSYSLPDGESGTLTIYDAAGRCIERITVKGSDRAELGTALASGVYLVRLESGGAVLTRKAVVLR